MNRTWRYVFLGMFLLGVASVGQAFAVGLGAYVSAGSGTQTPVAAGQRPFFDFIIWFAHAVRPDVLCNRHPLDSRYTAGAIS